MRTVVISTDDHPDYVQCLPFVRRAWNKLGWRTLTFYLGRGKPEADPENMVVELEPIPGYRSATIVQVSRLMGHRYVDGLIMTSDVDMMPLSNYWKPHPEKVTCYGADLTGYQQYPICYIAAPRACWESLVPESTLMELLQSDTQARSDIFDEWWFADQRIITKRINDSMKDGMPTAFHDRGLRSHWGKDPLPVGRIDRANWQRTKNSWSRKIDAHLPRPFDREIVAGLLAEFHGI
jgi:hypothetical protein